MTRTKGPARAFTLVELLVVIALVAVLIGILLPTLSRAREVARRARCLSKIHQIQAAADVHVDTHHGYYPLAGYLSGMSPDTLGDIDRAKYDYDNSTFSMTAPNGSPVVASLRPITDALAVVMGGIDPNSPIGPSDTDPTGYIRNFLCPSQTDDPNTIYVPGGLPYLYICYYNGQSAACNQNSSYVWNEFVLGTDTSIDPYPPGCLAGKASRVRLPAQTMLVADGLGSIGHPGAPDPVPNLLLYTTGAPDPATGVRPPSVSLADALAGTAMAGNPASFDRLRHRGKINVGFCDGHAESRDITPVGLTNAYLAPGR